MNVSAFVVFFTGAAALLMLPRRFGVGGRLGRLLNLVFPSWRFFEDWGHSPELWVRQVSDSAGLEALDPVPWRRVEITDSRRVWHLFVNARGNFHLAFEANIERLVLELGAREEDGSPDIETLVSFRIVRDSVCWFLGLELCETVRPHCFQFKIRVDRDDCVVSRRYWGFQQ